MGFKTRSPEGSGLFLYFIVTCALSWLPAWIFRDAWRGLGEPLVTRLLTASLLYAVTMGWQPYAAVWLVERWRHVSKQVDMGLNPAARPFIIFASIAPLCFTVLATLVAWGVSFFGISGGAPLLANVEPEIASQAPTAGWVMVLALAFTFTITVLWIQAFAEELGWRGYFLSGLMRRFGPWKGLFLHGLWWGIWYAPIIIIVNGGWERSLVRSASFILTCMCLGALLGWLRLAAKSIVPAVIANTLLTILAGLPFLLQGVEIGLRSAIYGPIGWLLMGAILTWLVFSRYRSMVVVPTVAGRLQEGVLGWSWLGRVCWSFREEDEVQRN